MYEVKYTTLLVFAAFLASQATATEILVDAGTPFNASKAGDDVSQLKRLALNVGSDFARNRVTDVYLEQLRIRKIRLINVGISGEFNDAGQFVEIKPSMRLKDGLDLCRRLQADPHIIIQSLPEQLLETVPLKVTRHRALGVDLVNKRQAIGPTNYKLLENWYLAYFEYIKIQQGFTNAVFEIFNEPDLGMLIYPTSDIPAKGSQESYECMFRLYRAASSAARCFEAKHPHLSIILGGPAITMAFTYEPSTGGWAGQFVKDCASENIKLDFLGLHHYASVAPFRGVARKDLTAYPAFPEMLASVRRVITEHMPGLPVRLTEYGAHHNVVEDVGSINGNHYGAAFCLDCLDQMLNLDIDSASYLVSSDQQRRDPKTKLPYNLYSWCSFMTAPDYRGYPYPKAPYHAYKMISELSGKRVVAATDGGNTRCLAVADASGKTLRILLWNYRSYVPEFEPVIHEAKAEVITLTIDHAVLPRDFIALLRIVDQDHGDVYSVDKQGLPLSLRAATPLSKTLPIQREGEQLHFKITMQPGSIAMVELAQHPIKYSLKTSYPEMAETTLKVMRDNHLDNSKKTIEVGGKLLQRKDLHPVQRNDALTLLVTAAIREKDVELANTYVQDAIELSRNSQTPIFFVVARRMADSYRERKNFTDAVLWYKKAIAAPDCDWRLRFGTELALIECLNADSKYREVIAFCDEVIKRQEELEHVGKLKGDYRLCQLRAWRDLENTVRMLTVYKSMLASDASVNAKLGSVISSVL